MKKLLALLTMLSGFWASGAATNANLTFNLQSSVGAFPSKVTVKIAPVALTFNNKVAVLSDPMTYLTDTNGLLTISNVAGGLTNSYYQVWAYGPRSTNISYCLMPATNCDFADIVVNLVPVSTVAGAYPTWASDARYLSMAGTNLVSWTSNGVRWVAGQPGAAITDTNGLNSNQVVTVYNIKSVETNPVVLTVATQAIAQASNNLQLAQVGGFGANSNAIRNATNNYVPSVITNAGNYAIAPSAANSLMLTNFSGACYSTWDDNGWQMMGLDVQSANNVYGRFGYFGTLRTTNTLTASTAIVSNNLTASNLWDRSNVKWWGAKGDGGVTDDTVAISNAVAWAQSRHSGRLYFPSGIYSNTQPINLTNGITIVGDHPTLVYVTNVVADAGDMAPLGGTWIDFGGTNGFIGHGLRGLKIESIGLKNFWKAMSFGADSVEGCPFASLRDIIGLGNPTVNKSEIGIEIFNSMFTRIDAVKFYSVNTGLRLVQQWSLAGGNSVISDFYVFTYPKSVANANNTKAGIEVLALPPTEGASNIMNSMTFIRPQVNSFNGDGTGTGIKLLGTHMGAACYLADFSISDTDVEGPLAYSIYVDFCTNFKLRIAASGAAVPGTVYIGANGYNHIVESGDAATVLTNASSGNPNSFFGAYAPLSTTNTMEGIYHIEGDTRQKVRASLITGKFLSDSTGYTSPDIEGTGTASYHPGGVLVKGSAAYLNSTITSVSGILTDDTPATWQLNSGGDSWLATGAGLKLGIGTNSPQAALHVGNGGSLLVDGSIKSDSIISSITNRAGELVASNAITLNGSRITAWPSGTLPAGGGVAEILTNSAAGVQGWWPVSALPSGTGDAGGTNSRVANLNGLSTNLNVHSASDNTTNLVIHVWDQATRSETNIVAIVDDQSGLGIFSIDSYGNFHLQGGTFSGTGGASLFASNASFRGVLEAPTVTIGGTNVLTRINTSAAAVTNSAGTAVFGAMGATSVTCTNLTVSGTATANNARIIGSQWDSAVSGQLASFNAASNLVSSGFGTNSWASQSAVNSASNASYTISSNVAQAKADIAMTTATNQTRAYAQPLSVGTNLATGAGQVIDMSQDSTVCITNALAGNTIILLTNIVDRKYFVLDCVADGTPRVISFATGGGTITWITTNGITEGTNFTVAANKVGTIGGRAWLKAGVTNVKIFGNVQP